MKITKRQLRRIIRESLQQISHEKYFEQFLEKFFEAPGTRRFFRFLARGPRKWSRIHQNPPKSMVLPRQNPLNSLCFWGFGSFWVTFSSILTNFAQSCSVCTALLILADFSSILVRQIDPKSSKSVPKKSCDKRDRTKKRKQRPKGAPRGAKRVTNTPGESEIEWCGGAWSAQWMKIHGSGV